MFTSTKLAKSIRLAIAFGVASTTMVASNSALAQDKPTEEEEASVAVEKVTITGSRIKRLELSSNTPVFTFSGENIAVRGLVNAADLLNESPLFSGTQTGGGAQNSNNAGQNQLDLFDLGSQRTLTLVNGRRLVSSQSAQTGGSQVDINTIPTALIERIEVVPLSGAATYGADAIAGTVNIILKEDYEGFEIATQYGDNEAGNARNFQVSTLGGGNFANGRGNITFGMEYTKNDGLLQCDQDFLCNNNPEFDDTQNSFLDLDGDGQPDDINGDGVADLQSVRLAYDEIRLALFTEHGAISPAGGRDRFLPGAGLGAMPDGNFYQFTPSGDLTTCEAGPLNSSSINTRGDDVCGSDFFNQVRQIRSPTTRFNTYGSFRFDLTDDITFKQDFLYSNTKGSELVNQGGFQTGFFGGTSSAITMNINNPLLSEQARNVIQNSGHTPETFGVQRFNNDLLRNGGNSNETHVWRVTNIVEGAFEAYDRQFYWDASVVHGRSDILVETSGIVDGRFLNAVDARTVDDDLLEKIRLQDPKDSTDDLGDLNSALLQLQGSNGGFTANFNRGDTICGAYADLAAGTLTGFNERATGSGLSDEDLPFLDGCEPLSLFGQTASDEALDFITGGSQLSRANNTQTVFAVNFGGTAIQLPAGSLDFVVGSERRIEKGDFLPALGLRVPVTRSAISRPVNGGFETEEYYAEVVVPIISKDMDIPFIQSLEFSGAYRIQDFTTNAPAGFDDRTTDADVYQASINWGVNDDISIRATLASAFRNPSINELFEPEQQAFVQGADPCDARSVGLGPNPAVRKANCEAIGIDTTTFDSDIQNGTIPNGIVSGNPDLEPETNDSYSIGFVYTPQFIEGLSIAVDYYNIEIGESINNVDFEIQAQTCFDSNNFPNEAACSSFVRNEENQVISARSGPANVALSTFESMTLNARYAYDLKEWGTLSFNSVTQHNITNEFRASATAELTEDAGDFANPDFSGTFDTNWSYGDFLVSHRLRWQSSVLIDVLEQTLHASNFTEDADGVLSGDFTNETSARFLHDLSVGYQVNESTSVQLNIQNLLERKPDGAGNLAFAANHFALDERLGRRLSVRFNTTF